MEHATRPRHDDRDGDFGARAPRPSGRNDRRDRGRVLDVNNFEVKDLGVDVAVETFVDEIKITQPDVVALSGFLTLSYASMKDTVEAIQKAGLRDKVKIMIGGGAVDEQICSYAQADAFGKDAMAAVALAKGWTGG